jgi:hypothetical protein
LRNLRYAARRLQRCLAALTQQLQESIDDGICRLAAVAIAQNALNVVKARCACMRAPPHRVPS